MGSGATGASIQFQPYNDNPYYNNTISQTPGWLQLQVPATATVSKNFTIEALARDAFSDPYIPSVLVSFSIVSANQSSVPGPQGTATFSGFTPPVNITISQVGVYTITASAPGFAPYTSSVTILPGVPTKLAFTGQTPGQMNTSSCTPLNVSLEDAGGNITNAPAAVGVTLAFTSSVLKFFTDSACGTALTNTNVSIPAGSSTYALYAWDDAPEQISITATSSSFITASVTASTLGKSIFMLGGQNGAYQSTVIGSTDGGTTWNELTPVNSSLHFQLSSGGNAIVFNHKIYYFGGTNGSASSAVYTSVNGTDWTLLGSPMPAARSQGAVVVWNQKIWYLGGYDNTNTATNTVWSFDGTSFQDFSSTAGFSSIAAEAAFVGSDIPGGPSKVFVVGGASTPGSTLNQIRSSTSPTLSSWALDSNSIISAITGGLSDTAFGIFDGAFLLVGGETLSTTINDVFKSSNGTTWASQESPGILADSSFIVHLNSAGVPQLSILGGSSSTSTFSNIVYNSPDGANWTASTNTLPIPIANAATVSFTPGL